MSKRTLAILAAIGATVIYGINHTVAKGVMPMHVKPFGFIFLRVGGATLLFWLISLFGPKEKIEKRDWGRLLVCSVLGMSINMLSFFKGLQLSTPINSAVLITISPIIVVVISALFLKERITLNKGLGIFMGFVVSLLKHKYPASIELCLSGREAAECSRGLLEDVSSPVKLGRDSCQTI